MARRKIIRIDEDLCNGCGECITGCAEGALQIVDGKATMVREDYCDGFGDCIGTCPTGALSIEEREVPDYDPQAARTHVARTRGQEGVQEFDRAQARHEPARPHGGCPGNMMRVFPTAGGGVSPSSPNPSSTGGTPAPLSPAGPAAPTAPASPPTPRPLAGAAPSASASASAGDPSAGDPGTVIPPSLGQWPIQLHLVRPGAPFFRDRELCLLSTCAPVAMPDAQWRFVRGRGIAVACPKLDRTEGYVEKLAGILSEPSIPRVVVVRMEVPCCRGLTGMAVEAARATGRDDLDVIEATVAADGTFLGETVVHGGANPRT